MRLPSLSDRPSRSILTPLFVGAAAMLIGGITVACSSYDRSRGNAAANRVASESASNDNDDANQPAPKNWRTIGVPAIPETVEDFKEWRDRVATTPEGGVAAGIVALYMYTQDARLGEGVLTIQLTARHRQQEEGGPYTNPSDGETYGLTPAIEMGIKDKIGWEEKQHIPRAYFMGATPANAYELRQPMSIRAHIQSSDAETARVFVACEGADSDRPAILHLENGVWKLHEYSSLLVSVYPMEEEEAGGF